MNGELLQIVDLCAIVFNVVMVLYHTITWRRTGDRDALFRMCAHLGIISFMTGSLLLTTRMFHSARQAPMSVIDGLMALGYLCVAVIAVRAFAWMARGFSLR